MPCPTLVVIDMQPVFEAAGRPKVIAGVTREIIQTKIANGMIIFVEYSGFLPTYTPLLDLVKGYSSRIRIKKRNNDGSEQIVRFLESSDCYADHFRICGVNTNACVRDTVSGLLSKTTAKIEVVRDACDWADTEKYDWRCFLRHRNLSLA